MLSSVMRVASRAPHRHENNSYSSETFVVTIATSFVAHFSGGGSGGMGGGGISRFVKSGAPKLYLPTEIVTSQPSPPPAPSPIDEDCNSIA
ncbi:hypothetical protein TIFTF001_049028 [Ficus carica]|uniref:Uncharacterized protein n=1 Tax=Ficus carica TaxID=3494 RepID=A0AA88CJ10_FICCA|nr:hypothetical protein TIFTF001_049028 [Ficus carica]